MNRAAVVSSSGGDLIISQRALARIRSGSVFVYYILCTFYLLFFFFLEEKNNVRRGVHVGPARVFLLLLLFFNDVSRKTEEVFKLS